MEDELYRLTARIFCATSTAWTIATICSPLQKGEGSGVRFLSDQKTIFDGTKLPVDRACSKTTTYSMKLLSSPDLDDAK
jgi:hypothetical protein